MILLHIRGKIISQVYISIAKFFKVTEQLSSTSFYFLRYKYYFVNPTYKLMYLTRKVNNYTRKVMRNFITETLYNTFSIITITIKIPFLMLLMKGFMFHTDYQRGLRVSTSDTEKRHNILKEMVKMEIEISFLLYITSANLENGKEPKRHKLRRYCTLLLCHVSEI